MERIVFADTTDREIDSWAELSFAERERLKRARDAKRDDLALAMRGTFSRGTNHPDWSKDEWTSAERSLGDYLGGGGEKDVYAFGDLVIGVRKVKGKRGGAAAYERRLIREVKALKTLQDYGVRVAEARLVRLDGVPALLMKRYAGGSKEMFIKGTKKIDPYSRTGMLLNQNSINDLRKLERLMIEKKFSINDLQFLIDEDGHLFVADAIAVEPAKGPSRPNRDIIKELINRASLNLL